ncbi:Bbp16 family capsid cement protein [Sphingobium yanoikuyae]|uniref:Bbp16 family capsid cement protein n=1 Tax=Sphingobium yanoikuyae TaxID=13690 RepID=UPI002FDED9FA
MIFDNTLLFSDGQAIVADAASTNVVDLGATGTPYGDTRALVRDIGKGCPKVPIWISVTEAFNNLTTLEILLQTDDNSAFASPKTVSRSGAIALADLVVGKPIDYPDYVPQGTNERYFRLFFDITGAAPTTGKITAGVVADRQTNFIGGQ